MKISTELAAAFFFCTALLCSCVKNETGLRIGDLGYFENRGVNVLVYSNNPNGGFNDEKNTGLEIIHHGVRTVQGGTVRLSRTPEQWDLMPDMVSRVVDTLGNSIQIALDYPQYEFRSRMEVVSKGSGLELSVWLDEPLPERLAGQAGFNLELLPSQFWNKSFIADGRENRFPRYASGDTETRPNDEKVEQYKGFRTYDDRGTGLFVDPLPFDTASSFVIAPESPERMLKISSDGAPISLFDGRLTAQNGWYVLRSELPSGKTGKVLTWYIEPNTIKGWTREPNIGFSQVGYTPAQSKVAVIELDRNFKRRPKAELWKIDSDGSQSRVFRAATREWGRYFKYDYCRFDFSEVKTPGLYYIVYDGKKSDNFIIGDGVYDHIADATNDVWIPVHMNHIAVNEGYRMWHGVPFKEGYFQAPESDHFDYHWQGPLTDTPYKAHQPIPGLNVGGFFDAGDFDIETGSIATVVNNLIRVWETGGGMRDETFVSAEQKYVDLHRPDGVADVLQYIQHGALNLVAQVEKIGYPAVALSNSVLHNYHHLGDAASITDGIPGTEDDMWAFTSRVPMLDLRLAATLAATSRALKGYDDDLAGRALVQAEKLWKEALPRFGEFHGPMHVSGQHDELSQFGFPDVPASIQLYAATGKEEYRNVFMERIWEALDKRVSMALQPALDAIPFFDEEYIERLRPYVLAYSEYVDGLAEDNPYGVPITLGAWAGSSAVAEFGTTVCYANRYYPDLIDRDIAYRAADWLFGCHPYHNYSLVAAVGASRPKNVFYGNNRADFSAIPGNVAPGILLHRPDHFENLDDWPFFWAENEGTIAGNTSYLIFAKVLVD